MGCLNFGNHIGNGDLNPYQPKISAESEKCSYVDNEYLEVSLLGGSCCVNLCLNIGIANGVKNKADGSLLAG
jgi:hypothetical protein